MLEVNTAALTLRGRGTTFLELSADELTSFRIPFPVLSEQRAVSAFLDHETAKIDALVAEQEQLIALLKEKRQAVISHAVTKGLNPDAPMKDSGIDWIGEIPVHWTCTRLKFLADGPFAYGANESGDSDNPNDPRFIRITDIDDAGNLRDDTFRSLARDLAAPYYLQPGDILLARSGATVGKAYIYHGAFGDACYAGYLIRLRPKSLCTHPEFLRFYTQSVEYQKKKKMATIQATIQNVSAEKYAQFWIPLPSLTEQTRIVETLRESVGGVDVLIPGAERWI